MNSPALFDEYEILDRRILASYGSLERVRYWVKGWHPELARYGYVHFIFGVSGKETELTRDEIHPIGIFEVKQACLHDSAGESSESFAN
jgi:hypothetical protein